MHNLLYYAMLFYGESGTMASECAVLGTPAIFLDNNGRLYTTEQEKMYGLVFNLSESLIDQRLSIERGVELLQTPNLKNEFHQRRLKLLRDKIDVSSFLVWFVENYPESMRIMTQEPDYHLRFRTTIGANLCA